MTLRNVWFGTMVASLLFGAFLGGAYRRIAHVERCQSIAGTAITMQAHGLNPARIVDEYERECS